MYGQYADATRAGFIDLVRMGTGMRISQLRDELLGDVPYPIVDTPEQRERSLDDLCTRALMIGSYA